MISLQAMKILISHISEDIRFFDFTVRKDRFNVPELREDVKVRVSAYRSECTYDISGHIETSLRLNCDRCLEEYTMNINEPFHVFYGDNGEEAAKEDNYVFLSEGETELDLLPYVRDTILLLIPFKKICSKDCQGLCDHCGANLNYETCSCDQDHFDPRWEKLKVLKKTLENAEE
jgi:uncharacterized protein